MVAIAISPIEAYQKAVTCGRALKAQRRPSCALLKCEALAADIYVKANEASLIRGATMFVQRVKEMGGSVGTIPGGTEALAALLEAHANVFHAQVAVALAQALEVGRDLDMRAVDAAMEKVAKAESARCDRLGETGLLDLLPDYYVMWRMALRSAEAAG